MIDPPPPPAAGAGMKAAGQGPRAKKPWSKPTLHRLDEMRGIGNGPKTPGSIDTYENRTPLSLFPQYMPQSATQRIHS